MQPACFSNSVRRAQRNPVKKRQTWVMVGELLVAHHVRCDSISVVPNCSACLLTRHVIFAQATSERCPGGATAESVTAPFSSGLQSPLGSKALKLHCEITAAIHQASGRAVLKHSLVSHLFSCAYLFMWRSTDKPWEEENHWHFFSDNCCYNW